MTQYSTEAARRAEQDATGLAFSLTPSGIASSLGHLSQMVALGYRPIVIPKQAPDHRPPLAEFARRPLAGDLGMITSPEVGASICSVLL